MEPQVSVNSEALLCHDVIPLNDGDCGPMAFSQNHDPPHPASNAVKKQTRQWAAWTRAEEECFFNALRQVGKNFEKITSRVQSKNKDQVRHYYYRLVRRMNKYLGPGLSIDAKNSKDTNAAMLRWWSLLEKFSCKVSKLHLKPRRFKIFLETLEHQLLKDRKRNTRKRQRPSQGENCPLTTPANISNQNRESGLEPHAVNLVLLESRNIQKLGAGKGSTVKRNVNIGVNRNSCKADSFQPKTSRQRRKPAATASTSAYKRWEKAAIAGVSLVADAAEHLERTTIDGTDKEVDHMEGIPDDHGMKDFNAVRTESSYLPLSSPETNVQISGKLKLQLFPIDESTRRALEMDNHNPHLELTLSTRKKISSVLEHLHRKWGNSMVASGEIMLFPYSVQPETLGGCLKWARDSVLSAADVYTSIGSPTIFRLRYGWLSSSESVSATAQATLLSSGAVQNINRTVTDMRELNKGVVQETNLHYDEDVFLAENILLAPSSTQVVECSAVDTNNNLVESSSIGPSILSHEQSQTSDRATLVEAEDKELQLGQGPSFSAKEWADSLTNISVGDLLLDVPHDATLNCIDTPIASQCPQQGPIICDSFDAAIAAHIYRHQNRSTLTPVPPSYASSIWEAEDTCDAFSFLNSFPCKEAHSASDALRKFVRTGQVESCSTVELVEEARIAEDCIGEEPTTNGFPTEEGTEDELTANDDPSFAETSANDLNGFADMFWPDSLGPLDLDIRTCRYHNEDLILSDSLSGLNRLLATSLDAFQNCSFFGLDKKETSTTSEGPGTASFADYKIDNSA